MTRVLCTTILIVFLVGVAWAVPTKVTVRAKSKDAKFIGSTMGGALVVIKDAETGDILAKGVIAGGTGNTQRIMVEPARRGVSISDESAAKYEATLDIVEPRFVTVEVSGPLGQKQSIAKSTTQVWLIPGRHVEGDGVMVEIPGLAVDVMAPQAHEVLKLAGGKASVPVRANVVLM